MTDNLPKKPDLDFATVPWSDVLTCLAGIHPDDLLGHPGPCPICGGRDRFRFTNKDDRGRYYCRHCGAGTGLQLMMRTLGIPETPYEIAVAIHRIEKHMGKFTDAELEDMRASARAAIRQDNRTDEEKLRTLRRVWDRTRPLNGNDPASLYLKNRIGFIQLNKLSDDIRWHPHLRYYPTKKRDMPDEEERVFPAMILNVRDKKGISVTLHRIYLTPDGHKAPVYEPKKMMSGTRKVLGESVLICRNAESRVLDIGEGIENSAAIATRYQYANTTIAGINCWNLAALDLDWSQYDLVRIYGDHDAYNPKLEGRPGEICARKLQSRILDAGPQCLLDIPTEEGVDHLDLWANFCERYKRKHMANRAIS